MFVKETEKSDLSKLLELYTHLHDNTVPEITMSLLLLWERLICDANHHIIVGIADDILVSSCVLIVVPNLTHNQRPYALVENVVTHKSYRNKGCATAVLEHAKNIAVLENCYKIMLMTSSKNTNIWDFYEKSGYNRIDKTAFVQWL